MRTHGRALALRLSSRVRRLQKQAKAGQSRPKQAFSRGKRYRCSDIRNPVWRFRSSQTKVPRHDANFGIGTLNMRGIHVPD